MRLDSPLGPLWLQASDAGITRVSFEPLPDSPVSPADAHLDQAARELAEYFAGQRTHFDVAVDLPAQPGFRARVQEYLPRIGFGETETYGGIARLLGNPQAARAVGTACASNPVPIIVPCHRVLRGDGSLGGYLGGAAAKLYLLRLEGSAILSGTK